MKKIYWLAIFSIISFSASGQKAKTAMADRYYDRFQYHAAAKAYEQLLKSDPTQSDVKERLVNCYVKLNNPERALFWLDKALNVEEPNSSHFKTYATLLAANGKYEEAAKWFGKAYETNKDSESLAWLNTYKNLSRFYEDSALYQINKMPINSSHSDFSPVFYGDGLVFCSARINGKTNKDKYNQFNAWFVDLYYVKSIGSEPEIFSSRLNSSYHEGPVAFSANQDTVYFTRSNFLQKKGFSNDGVNKLKIYYAAVKEGNWGTVHDFELNNNEYSIGHPAFASGNVMYFTSDMPGGFGGTDLYKTEKVNGKWQKPVNLGAKINTSGNEMFPYIDQEGNLYFASNGHPGLGGLDLFYVQIQEANKGSVVNFGFPINTSSDDFGLIIKENKGYFSSNRNTEVTDDNIYSFKINRNKLIYLIAKDEKGNILKNVDLRISGPTIKEERSLRIEELPLELNWEYGKIEKMKVSKDGFIAKELSYSKADFFKLKAFDTLTVTLSKGGTTAKKEVIKGGKIIQVILLNEDEEVLNGGKIEATDMNNGSKNTFTIKRGTPLKLQVAPGKSFKLKGSMKGYKEVERVVSAKEIEKLPYGKQIVIILSEDKPGEPVQPKKVARDEMFGSGEVGEVIELGIKYDVNKADIRTDMAPKLDKLVAYMKQHPNVKIELGSHTDNRGSEVYNKQLSQKRAEAAVNYMSSKGISKNRMRAVGYGKGDLKVTGAQSEIEHQQNRRTTVKIIAN